MTNVVLAQTTHESVVLLAVALLGWFSFFHMGPLLALVSEQPTITARNIGVFFGLIQLIAGIGGFVSPVVVGWIRGSTGVFDWGFIFAALMTALLLIPGFMATEQDEQ